MYYCKRDKKCVHIRELMAYTEEQITKYCELAQEIGVGRAKKELGYPNSWATGNKWCELRGISVAKDDLAARAAAARDWYTDKEIIVGAEAGMEEVHHAILTRNDLTADEMKKYSESYMKWYNVWAAVQGKASNISESRTRDLTLSPEIMAMFDDVEKENIRYESEEKPGISV